MKSKCAVWTLVLAAIFFPPRVLSAQQKPGPIAPAERLEDGWEEIDPRLVFLMVRLANVEASLDVVDKATGRNTIRQSSKTNEARQAELGNERMDRNAGGPMKWQQFYGRTAEKFFYHPTDRNTTYHTLTVLGQRSPHADNRGAEGVPSRQGLPVHQRPPQFDYIYRANQNAKERAERQAAKLKEKVAALLERRQRLEAEQSALWCEVAFRAVSHYDLDRKSLYRFEPLVVGTDTTARQRAEIVKANASFMRLALSIIDDAQADQAATFSKIKPAVSDARQTLTDTWLRQAVDATDRTTSIGKFAALAKRLDDVASNLCDSYVVSVEGDREKDQQRKDTFRALLQESLVSYAQIILALDEMSVVMQREWKIKPDLDKPLSILSVADGAPRRGPQPSEALPTEDDPDAPKDTGRPSPLDGQNVLESVDLRNTLYGTWIRNGKDVQVLRKPGHNILPIPFELGNNYTFKLVFTKVAGSDVCLILPVGSTAVELVVSGWNEQAAGIDNVDGQGKNNVTTIHPPKLENNHEYTLDGKVTVRGNRATVTTTLDGREYIKFQGEIARLTLPGAYTLLNPRQLALVACDANVVFHELKVLRLTEDDPDAPKGTGRPLWLDGTDVLESLDLRNATKGTWIRNGKEIRVAKTAGHSTLPIPLELGQNYKFRLTFTRVSGSDLSLIIPVGSKRVDLVVIAYDDKGAGINAGHDIRNDVKRLHLPKLENNHRYTFEGTVTLRGSTATITTTLDGRSYVKYHGDSEEWDLAGILKGLLPTPNQMALCTYDADIEFHALQLSRLPRQTP